MMHSFTVTFGAKHLTGMVTGFPPYETFNLIKNNILHQSKSYKNQILGHIGHVTYSFMNIAKTTCSLKKKYHINCTLRL